MFRKTHVVRTYEDHVVLAGDHFVVKLGTRIGESMRRDRNVNANC